MEFVGEKKSLVDDACDFGDDATMTGRPTQ